MMINPFYFGFPPSRKPYSNYPHHIYSSHFQCNLNNSNFSSCNNTNNSNNDFNDNFEQNKNISNGFEEFFEIFGLKLYFDDLLIIALLFFLYNEDVKDTYLYIALILLLLS